MNKKRVSDLCRLVRKGQVIFFLLVAAVVFVSPSGALVHIPHERFPQILSRILKALKPEGLALITTILNRSASVCPNVQ